MVATEATAPKLWRHPTLRVLLAAETASMLGTQLSSVAIPWLALEQTGSPRVMGLVMAAQFAAIAVFGILGAPWAARFGPRRVMIAGDALRAPLMALIPLLHHFDLLGTGLFMVVTFAVAAFVAPYQAAQQTTLPSVVGEDEALLSRANAALQSATRLSVLLGPVLSGVLIATIGASTTLLIDAVSFGLSALLLAKWLPRPAPKRPGTRPSLRAGIRVLVGDRLVAGWSVGLAFGEMSWQALFAALPVIAMSRADGSSVVSGVLLASFGGGALVGTLFVGVALKRLTPRQLVLGGRIALGLAFIPFLLPLSVPWLVAMLLLTGLFNGLSSAPVQAVRLGRIPSEKRAESLTVAMAFALGCGTAGWVLSGTVTESWGLTATFGMLVAFQAVGAAAFVFGAVGSPSERREIPV